MPNQTLLVSGGVVLGCLVIGGLFWLFERRVYGAPPSAGPFSRRQKEKFFRDEEASRKGRFESEWRRYLDVPGLGEAFRRKFGFNEQELEHFTRQEAARKQRRSEMQSHRLVDLPGYREWAAQFQGITEIFPDIDHYRLLVHPEELAQSFEEKFASLFQDRLNDYAARGIPRRKLSYYRKP